jgi:sarcosine oxidase
MYHPLDDPGALPRTSYIEAAPPAPAAPPLAGEARADICIIGAGFTGLSAALHAAAAGARVIVLEANEVGWGGSGRNFGQVVPYLKHEPWTMLQRFGPDHGERLIQAAAEAADLVFALIERHGMSCEAVRNGLIFAALTPRALGGLERRAAFWQSRGLELPVLGAAGAAQAIGGGTYWGALLEPRGGTMNSLAYARGLADAAAGAGVSIHAASRVSSLARDGAAWRLRTAHGTVRSDQVLICTNAYTDELWPGLGRSLIPLRAYQLATEPVPEHLRDGILPGGRALTDSRRLMSGVRLHPNGRLHVSGVGPLFGPERRPDYDASTRRLLGLFPRLGRIDWAFHWSGWVAMTSDELPHLHALAPGVLAGLGYSGRGIALATIMGRELARGAMGTPVRDLLMPASTPSVPHHIPFAAVARAGVRALATSYRLRDAIELSRYGRGPQPTTTGAA